jgi:DNA-binding NarL/FixJ family response regulator
MNILVIDDHAVMREGLAALLGQGSDPAVVWQAKNADDAFQILETCGDLDVIIIDLIIPGVSGHAFIADVGRRRPETPIIVLSSSEAAQDAKQAFAQGAMAYVPKSASHTTLMTAIGLVLSGEIYVPPLVLDLISETAPATRPASISEAAKLTDRQTEILKYLSMGHSNKVIARALNLSEKTVKAHISAIFKTMHVANRYQAISAGKSAGLI